MYFFSWHFLFKLNIFVDQYTSDGSATLSDRSSVLICVVFFNQFMIEWSDHIYFCDWLFVIRMLEQAQKSSRVPGQAFQVPRASRNTASFQTPLTANGNSPTRNIHLRLHAHTSARGPSTSAMSSDAQNPQPQHMNASSPKRNDRNASSNHHPQQRERSSHANASDPQRTNTSNDQEPASKRRRVVFENPDGSSQNLQNEMDTTTAAATDTMGVHASSTVHSAAMKHGVGFPEPRLTTGKNSSRSSSVSAPSAA